MPTMTERSLMRMGSDGLVMTIPKSWARYYKLQAGDRLTVITNGELIVKPKPRRLPNLKAEKLLSKNRGRTNAKSRRRIPDPHDS